MPRIAKDTSAAGYIMLAAPARGLEILVAEQYAYIMSLDNEISAEEQVAIDTLKLQTANLNKLDENSHFTNKDLPLNLSKTYWLDLKNYDIVSEAQKIKQALLIVQGGRDYQVLAKKDFKIWQDTFKHSDNVTLKLFPKLNHLMVSGETPSVPDEYFKSAKVDEVFITMLGQWIKNN